MNLDLIYPDVRVRVVRVHQDMLRIHGRKMRICQGARSFLDQARLYAQGRTAPGPRVTDARPLQSTHNFGCGTDSCFEGQDPWLEKDKDEQKMWAEFGRFGRLYGLEWGGCWHHEDRPHLEQMYGLKIEDLQELYHAGKTPGVWTKFDQIRGVEPGDGWEKLRPELLLL